MAKMKIQKIIKSIIIASFVIVICISFTACAPKKYGEFYSLQEAYDKGILTREDLLNIAYYNNGYTVEGFTEEGFTPLPLNPEKLSEDTENKIKETRAYDLRQRGIKTTVKDVWIAYYCGTYNGAVAVLVYDNLNHLTVEREINVDGIKFVFSNSRELEIWKAK